MNKNLEPLFHFSAGVENAMDYIIRKHKRKSKEWPNGNGL